MFFLLIERFSFECRKVIGFALSTRCDWLKRFAPPFHPIRSKTKANCDALARFSRALRQPHVITSSFDWFNVLSVSYVIGQSNYFGFGFTTLKRKPLYNLFLFLPFSLPSRSSLLKLRIVVIQKFCYHGNVTSHSFFTQMAGSFARFVFKKLLDILGLKKLTLAT